MKSIWHEKEASESAGDPLKLRIYSSRLLGKEPDLVLHGGGNTSLKSRVTELFGDSVDAIYVKGSGCDLKTINADGFTLLRLDILKRIVTLESITDQDLLRLQRSAMLDPAGPSPSIETLLHALIPYRYVDHTHPDALVTISNSHQGEERISEIYGKNILIVPYIRPGFMLARAIHEKTRNIKWDDLDGIILLNHGLFTFSDDAGTSYERMIRLASLAEEYMEDHGALHAIARSTVKEDLSTLAQIRRQVSSARGRATLARLDQGPEAGGFADLPKAASIIARGPITLDHVIRIKPFPALFGNDPRKNIDSFTGAYRAYFEKHEDGGQTQLDPAPRWGVWPGHGIVVFGRNIQEMVVVHDIVSHNARAVQQGEALGGWKGISQKHIFDMEYWELQQAKLKTIEEPPPLQGKVALVTGAASGIGRACADMMSEKGAVVIGLDLNPEIENQCTLDEKIGIVCDATDDIRVAEAIEETIRTFGGLDILISNVGIFTAAQRIEDMDPETWNRSIEINLSSHQRLFRMCIPYLKEGIDPAIVIIASKNVPAPGPGASAYSVAKAGLTQLGRIAAMELGRYGIRVNMIHPDAVYDTALWTQEVLEERAKHYSCTIEEYKTRNMLKTEVSSRDVAALALAMVGPAFAKTTGAQVPIDGGNDRVI